MWLVREALDGSVVHTDGRPLAKLDHLAQTHAGSREVCIMADRVHELSRLFPRHGSTCRGLAARSPWRGDKLASSGYVLMGAQQRTGNSRSLVVSCIEAAAGWSKVSQGCSRPARVTELPQLPTLHLPQLSKPPSHRAHSAQLPAHAEA